MSTKRRTFKRPYKPSIDSYFTCFSPDHPTAPAHSPHPAAQLPTHIQSSLLNVGMRVRKAVPEGYKTKSLFETVGTYACGCSSAGTQAQESEYKGLVPYCGISKVGALRLQGAPDEKAGLALDIDDWSCPSSQALGGTDVRPTSVAISRSANYKRRRDGDDQEHEIVELQPVYPRSGHIINHAKASDPNALRVIAIPRTRRIREGEAMKRGVDGNVNMTSTEDFEEAEFFRGEEWANLVLEF